MAEAEKLLEEIRDLLIEIRDHLIRLVSVDGSLNRSPNHAADVVKNRPWKTYLEEKNPKNDYEIIALVVDNFASTDGSLPTKKNILDFFRSNPDRLENTDSKQLNDAIDNTKNNRSYGYIEYAESDKTKGPKEYRLSIKGKQLVERLPERPEKKKHGKNKTKNTKARR